MSTPPFVSVIIVNYNGAHFLRACLHALEAQTYPRENFEVIVSDNASGDGSNELLSGEFPWVKVIINQKNLGFAGGNNVAIAQAKGDFLALVNNDTAPNKTWLAELVQAAVDNPGAGIICGRSQLFYNQLVLEIQSDCFTPQGDLRSLGVQLFNVDTGVDLGVIQYLDGFSGWEGYTNPNEQFRWTTGSAKLGIPIPLGEDIVQVRLRMAAPRPDQSGVIASLKIGDYNLGDLTLDDVPRNFEVSIPAHLRNLSTPLVQNAGSLVDFDGYGRDRGTLVINHEVLFAMDTDQYNLTEEIFAACGTNMLLRKTMIERIGAFDDRFFAYYEDTDLSWRAWLSGWKVLYTPSAVIRHIHCGTSKEWSPLFIFLVERNRLAMLMKNGTSKQAWGNWIRYSLALIKKIWLIVFRFLTFRGYPDKKRVLIQIRVVLSLLAWLPVLLRKRRAISQMVKLDRELINSRFLHPNL